MAKNEAPPTIEVKLFVDKEKRNVLFAESDKEFVDVLFGFLTMPLGTVVRLLDKQSQMGCLDEVYKSVEDLSADYFETKACKAMLLKPLNAASSLCCQLKINIDDTKPRAAIYVCKDTSCCARDDFTFSSVPDTVCRCGKVMESVGDWPPDNGAKTESAGSDYGVFVKGRQKFITTDDLQVAPASTSLMLSLCKKFGVQDPNDLDKTTLQLTSDKITSLLRRSLTSKQPLTGLHFDVPISPDDAPLVWVDWSLWNEQVNEVDDKVVKIKVLQTKTNSAVLYAEVGHDFVDLVFGLLSVPLGSVAKAFCQPLPNGCIDNLYRSIDGCAEGCMRAECKNLLLTPELPPFFGCGASQILQVNQIAPRKIKIDFCFTCFKIGGFSGYSRCHQKGRIISWDGYDPEYGYINCQKYTKTAEVSELDPKSPEGKSDHHSAYVKQEPQNFMVTDCLRVSPLSLDSCLRVVSDAKVEMKELVEKEVTLTKFQVREIQRAALMSRDALSSVLVPLPRRRI